MRRWPAMLFGLMLLHTGPASAQQPAAGEEARALLKSLGSEVRRIQRVTEDYLKFARMPKPRPETVQLNDVISQGVSFMESLFEATRVEVEWFDRHLKR